MKKVVLLGALFAGSGLFAVAAPKRGDAETKRVEEKKAQKGGKKDLVEIGIIQVDPEGLKNAWKNLIQWLKTYAEQMPAEFRQQAESLENMNVTVFREVIPMVRNLLTGIGISPEEVTDVKQLQPAVEFIVTNPQVGTFAAQFLAQASAQLGQIEKIMDVEMTKIEWLKSKLHGGNGSYIEETLKDIQEFPKLLSERKLDSGLDSEIGRKVVTDILAAAVEVCAVLEAAAQVL